ncbi:MAG: hypothetical protein LUD00_07755 [Prevotellaceae bacterium]|nr:hypothetical protein [Prevotellaceae bacterium]
MKIKVRIKHFKIKKCQGKEFIASNLKENDICGKCNLLWSSLFKILNLSLFLFEEKEIVEKNTSFIFIFEEHCTIIVTNICNSVANRNTMKII